MSENLSIKEVNFKQGIGIWGNRECIKCGACCYNWNLICFRTGITKTERCEYFSITDGKANCSAHGENKPYLCKMFFVEILILASDLIMVGMKN